MPNFDLYLENYPKEKLFFTDKNSFQKPKITIATSIAPVGLEKQQAAIQSWLDLEFTVVSLNIQKEIDILQPVFKDVHFALVENHGKEQYGKPFVYVSDVLDYLSKYGTSVCGIVNSDILLRAGDNFTQFLSHEGKDSVIISSRIDIDEPSSETGEFYHYGFDLFFFDRQFLSYYPQSDTYCLGIPWWDYWIPLIAKQNDLNLKIIENTVVYHVKHEINYSIKNWREVGLTFTKQYNTVLFNNLKELFNSEDFEELDKQLGDNITYNLIQMFFKTSNLVTYNPEKIFDSCSEIFTQKTIELNGKKVPEVLNNEYSINSSISCVSNKPNHKGKAKTQVLYYETFILYAWHLYNFNAFKQMVNCLAESTDYRDDFTSPSQFIFDWIEKFSYYSSQYGREFDANEFSDLNEWKELTISLLIY